MFELGSAHLKLRSLMICFFSGSYVSITRMTKTAATTEIPIVVGEDACGLFAPCRRIHFAISAFEEGAISPFINFNPMAAFLKEGNKCSATFTLRLKNVQTEK